MNDTGEFEYARNVVYEVLDEMSNRPDLPQFVVRGITEYVRLNLENIHKVSPKKSYAYCACLTFLPDDARQWATYASSGKGFAIGFDLLQYGILQVPAVQAGTPFLYWTPVIYDEADQRRLVSRLVEAGIYDLQTFGEQCSRESKDLTALRDRVTQEIVIQLIGIIDFIKAPMYSREREMRLFLDPNDGTQKASNVQYCKRDNERVPFIFLDMRSPRTKRIPIVEIRVGPEASFLNKQFFLDDLLDELGYGSGFRDRPLITRSTLTK